MPSPVTASQQQLSVAPAWNRAAKPAAALLALAFQIMLGGRAALARSQPSEVALMKRVNAALRDDRRLNGASAYTTAPGVVVLYGTVFDEHDRELGARVAHNVRGVRHVDNTLRTKTGKWREEEARINDTLLLNDLQGVSVTVIGSQAYLSGQVSSQAEKDRAVRVVSSVSKLHVVNLLRIVPGPLFSNANFF